MRLHITLVICLVIAGRSKQDEDVYLNFPEGFKLGAGGSSYQIEGAWNTSNRGENVWDRFTHTQPWKISDGSNGDITCDSYHKYKEDVQLLKQIGLDHYRFSISWSRILPNGFPNSISQEGLRFYHNLLDELIANGIEPIVTLYHWDHPQILEDMGGWTNDLMVGWFTQYVNVIFRELGPKVKIFTTINEPQLFCANGYERGSHAPGKVLGISARYLCGHNALKAHAEAYHLYEREYRSTQQGKIGLTSHCTGFLPKTPSDTIAADIAFQFTCGWISHPIYIGDYPEVLKTKLAESSRAAGLPNSPLPEFSPEWIEYIRGTSDYFGLNHYTSHLAELNTSVPDHPLLLDSDVVLTVDPSWKTSSLSWLYIVPEGFGELLRKIKSEYNNPSVYITENGVSDIGTFDDQERIKYHYSYLKELLLATNRDGCNVKKYNIWSLIDTFEWSSGYDHVFGVFHVNFSSPNRERVPKLSVNWWTNVMRTKRLQPPIPPPANASPSAIAT